MEGEGDILLDYTIFIFGWCVMLRSIFMVSRPVPAEHQRNFFHLYLDIAWFGVLSGSAISFLAVYAARLGASALALGLLSASPAIINLIFTLPAGRWLEKRPVDRAVFWTSVFHRFFYLLFVPLPFLLGAKAQLWALIGLTLAMTIPGTALAVGFNALFATAVPPEWRGHVVGVRNALLSLTYIATSLISGEILARVAFPAGYQWVFLLGFVGAAMSSLHLAFVRVGPPIIGAGNGRSTGDYARPGQVRGWIDGVRANIGLRFLTRWHSLRDLRLDILRSPFGTVVGVLFGFHLTQFLAIPIFPLYWVDVLHLSDKEIGWGTAAFYLTVLIGSTQLARLTHRLGNKKLIAVGACLMALYPDLIALSQGLGLFLLTSAVGGFIWSIMGGGLSNYLLERVPAGDRPAHLAWYNLALNGAVLIGSLLGPVIANTIGLHEALLLFVVCRLLTGIAIWRWG